MTPVRGARGIGIPGLDPPQEPRADRRRVADAAQQFEALLISQMLQSIHESGDGGWTGTDNDDAGSQAVELAEEQLAQAMATHGGLGLAQMVVRSLRQAEPPTASDAVSQKLQP